MNYQSYWLIVLKRYLEWAYGHVAESAILAIVVFILGTFIQYVLSGTWPSLKQSLGDFMASAIQVLIFGVLAVLVLIGIGAVVAFFVVPPQMHEEQIADAAGVRGQLGAANEKLKAALEERMPKLRVEIESVFGCEIVRPDVNDGGKFGIVLWVGLRNTGEPTAAEKFEVVVKIPDGRTATGRKVIFAPDANFSFADRVIGAADLLPKKAATPLARGGVIHGYLMVYFDDLKSNDLDMNGTTFIVTCRDVWDNSCGASLFTKGILPKSTIPEGSTFFLPGE